MKTHPKKKPRLIEIKAKGSLVLAENERSREYIGVTRTTLTSVEKGKDKSLLFSLRRSYFIAFLPVYRDPFRQISSRESFDFQFGVYATGNPQSTSNVKDKARFTSTKNLTNQNESL